MFTTTLDTYFTVLNFNMHHLEIRLQRVKAYIHEYISKWYYNSNLEYIISSFLILAAALHFLLLN